MLEKVREVSEQILLGLEIADGEVVVGLPVSVQFDRVRERYSEYVGKWCIAIEVLLPNGRIEDRYLHDSGWQKWALIYHKEKRGLASIAYRETEDEALKLLQAWCNQV